MGNGRSRIKPGQDACSEANCLAALAAGNDAWPEFIYLYGTHLYCRFRDFEIGPGNLRDDLLQELILRLLNNERRVLKDFVINNRGGTFKSLLTSIVRSVVIDHIRKSNRQTGREVLADIDALVFACGEQNGQTLDEQLEQDKACAELLRRITGTADFRRGHNTLLKFIRGYSVSEIAEESGVSPNAVSQRLRYYRKKLKAVLAAGTNDEDQHA